MSVKRFSISFDAELAGALMGAIQDFEDEHGVITEKELAASRRRLGVAAPGTQRRSA